MQILSETASDDSVERQFTVGDVPGVLWCPNGHIDRRPLVLVSHGGGQHKQAPAVLGRVHLLLACGYAAAAIDAPGHGDRPHTASADSFADRMRQLTVAGEPLGPLVARFNAEVSKVAALEWAAVLGALRSWARWGPVGFWGVSMGGAIGVQFVAADPRVAAAVLGLVGTEAVGDVAAEVTLPLRFLMQWDDEAVPRASALALYDGFASREKTLHANPGRHADVPRFEHEEAVRFLQRQLGQPAHSAT